MDKIKVLSWNVEHFKADKQKEIAEIIKSYDPDVFGIYEVESNSVYDFMKTNFPKYSVFITDGQQSQEILVACRNKYESIKFQQKKEFRTGNPSLRPGAFLTFAYPGKKQYNFLFLHTDSGTTAVDFGNRTEMFEHAYNLKRKLDYDNGTKVNFIMLGDLNTMGLEYPRPYKSDTLVETPQELEYLDFHSGKTSGSQKHKKLKPDVRRLSKPAGTHYSKTYGISDLDHIIVSKDMKFTEHENYNETGKYEIKLDGWRQFLGDETKLKQYADEISDHCLLYCEIKVE